MTDLPEEEREAFRRAFPPPFDDLGPAGVCTCDTYPLPIEDHGDECAVRALYEGWMARREYSKQREEKLQGGVIAALRILQDRTIGSPEACERASRALVAAIAENGDSEPVGQWYESRSGLLDRFCEIDTSNWDEGDFFHFLEKPWQSQYEIDRPQNAQNEGSVPDGLGDRRPGT